MKEINVKGTVRTVFGKKAARDIRRANAVPCNLYGEAKDETATPVAIGISPRQTNEHAQPDYLPDVSML